jgi:hypothetical protein
MTQEEFMKIEKEWVKNEIPTMFYIGELLKYKNSLESRISELEAPKTCVGCKYLSPETDYNYEFCKKEEDCARWGLSLPDHYKAKDN